MQTDIITHTRTKNEFTKKSSGLFLGVSRKKKDPRPSLSVLFSVCLICRFVFWVLYMFFLCVFLAFLKKKQKKKLKVLACGTQAYSGTLLNIFDVSAEQLALSMSCHGDAIYDICWGDK